MSYTESSFNPKIVKDENGVRILDPNPTQETVPMEDMFIYVSLVARQKSKTVLTEGTDNSYSFDTKHLNTIDLTTPQDTIDGTTLFSKPNLTTDWTEINGHNVELHKDYEGFGITNIDIEIKSQLSPKVVIDFVDVRGATLFEQGSCSPYGLFFNLPYPTFILTLKGYYGRPVEYYLNLVKFNAKFNSETGNMDCRAEFIGYSFAFLSDAIVGYVAASQYLPNSYGAQSKLRNKYVATTNRDGNELSNFCDNPVVGNGRCYTINDLLFKLRDFDKTTKPQIANSPEFNKLDNLESIKQSYEKYKSDVIELGRKLEEAGCKVVDSARTDVNSRQRFNIENATTLTTLLSTGGVLQEFLNNKSGSIPVDIKLIKTTDVSSNETVDDIGLKVQTNATALVFKGTEGDNNDCPGCSKLFNLIADKPWNNIFVSGDRPNGITVSGITFDRTANVSNETTPFIDLGIILQDIDTELNKLTGENGVLTTLKKQVISSINDIVKEALGFNPTIRNIFTILLCNTDAFMDIILEVAKKSESYHLANASDYKELVSKSSSSSGNGMQSSGLTDKSGNPKVYAWPTFYKRGFEGKTNGKKQGTKEAFPGVDSRFTGWEEVRFVEDFIDALLNYKKDLDLLNGEREGRAGLDNYVPISPLESPVWSPDSPIKYLEQSNKEEIYTTIGERMFIALDHTLFSPIRTTSDAQLISQIGKSDWNPIKNSDSQSLASYIGEIEAWNFMNCQEGDSGIKVLSSMVSKIGTLDEFKQSIINSINRDTANGGYGPNSITSVKASTLQRVTPTDPSGLGFDSNDNYWNFKTPNGILLSHPTRSPEPIIVKSNPFEMDIKYLFKILDVNDTKGDFAIKIEPSDGPFATAVTNYTTNVQSKTNGITFTTPAFKEKPKTDPVIDEAQKILTWDDRKLYTTLAAFGVKNVDGNDWWTSDKGKGNISQSNMGLISYWDYEGTDETYGITLFKGINYTSTQKKDFKLPSGSDEYKLDDGLESGAIDEDGIGTSFITTPLWLDNINTFRGSNLKTPSDFSKTFYLTSDINSNKNYNTSDIQHRNLAYLFLHTLKMTPLVIRYINDNGEFFTSSQAENNGGYSFIYSLKAFNTSGGVAKMPKAWALTIGAELWRWKMFVGTKTVNGKQVWNKPLTCESCGQGDTPNGYDPLSQPGWNSVDGKSGNFYQDDRNNYNSYLNKVYSVNTTWNIQQSSFSTPTNRLTGTLSNKKGQDLGDGAYVYFNYYGLNRDRIGYEELKNRLNPDTLNNVKSEYSWPQMWISPHHIPYVQPERFFDNEGEGTAYVQLFNNNMPYIDYQTIMPQKRDKSSYFESDDFSSKSQNARTKEKDGNLGMVLQYLPDDIKDTFVKFFDDWVKNQWVNMLPKVDPVNFGGTNGNLLNSYYWDYETKQDISYNILGNSNNTATLVLKDETTEISKLISDEIWILNSTPKIWYGIDGNDEFNANKATLPAFHNDFVVSDTILTQYLTAFYNTYKDKVDEKITSLNKKKNEQNSGSGGNALDDDDVKLSLYRTFKSLTDKWISSTPQGESFFNVTSSGRNCGKDFQGPRTLASHFQYVNRVMGDIGDLAVINVSKLQELQTNNKISLYQYISDLLTDNEYMFFPLPGYVDFTSQGVKKEDLEDMFRPVLSLDKLSCGPVFLCMYVGGNSRQLQYKGTANCPADLKELQNLEDDSFWVSDPLTAPSEISDPGSVDGSYTAFKIVYGQDNQNHFKNIQLDQSEFSETAESLSVIDKLSQQGGSDQTTKGQNLNSVYLTRSYSCQVESLGNMMIQPMTYFDLMGVPMFNGAYLITEVHHTFKPNHATTTFKGTRQPRATIPVVTDAAIAMNLNFKDGKSDGTGSSLSTISDGVKKQGKSKTNNNGVGNDTFDLSSNGEWKPQVDQKSSIYSIVKKEWKDDDIIKYIQGKVEGGYYHPVQHYVNPGKFTKDGVDLYLRSGETMFGEDRAAGQTETLDAGKEFWALIDKNSGYGSYGTLGAGATSENNYSRKHVTEKWEGSILEELKSKKGWTWNYDGGPIKEQLQVLSRKISIERIEKNFNTYFKGYPELLSTIKSDGRFLFLYYRASFNGVGFFKTYASNLKKVWDGGERNVEKLMTAELDYRWAYANTLKPASMELIKNGVIKYGTSVGWDNQWENLA